MKYLKRQSTSNKTPLGNAVVFDINEQVVMDTRRVMLIPKGTEAERPVTPNNGHMRYNTTSEEFESYQDNAWRKVRFKEPRAIVQQTFSGHDGTETTFGPLDNQDADFTAPDSAQAMLVLIENVFQLATTNYTLTQSDGTLTGPNGPYAAGWYIVFSSPVPIGKDVTVLHNFNK